MADAKCCCWGFLWFLILIFISWPLALFVSWIFILFSILAGCIQGLQPAMDALMMVMMFPNTCAKNMISGKAIC
ncbi:uncharacterized protein DEA37_0007808 [Paragonimus westermani]|uniref:Caveolin n=1 Tax=Paragonimus westermani TaxID=34504 RepID=A0A5J4NRR8_9TREM|nr:uncharacterized protein DEA37_0007808 [Paragonimus westermani]